MPSVLQLIKYLTPAGTDPDPDKVPDAGDPWVPPDDMKAGGPWDVFPIHPPDLFAVAATLVSHTDCYSHPRYSGMALFTQAELDEVRRLAALFAAPQPADDDLAGILTPEMRRRYSQQVRQWYRALTNPHERLQVWWRQLTVTYRDHMVDAARQPTDPPPPWWDAAIYLMVVADEACRGVGFLFPRNTRQVLSNQVFDEYARYQEWAYPEDAPPWPGGPQEIQFPDSLCRAVPACKVCVQPKTHTSQVGYTMNALSHHVALLPPRCQVMTQWFWGAEEADVPTAEDAIFRFQDIDLLLVPYPYRIDDAAFVPGGKTAPHEQDPGHFFGMDPTWLHDPITGARVTATELVDGLLLPLVNQAKAAGRSPEWLVLPELALTRDLAAEAAKLLAEKTHLQMFVTGCTASGADGFTRNQVYGAVFVDHAVAEEWDQSKHHPWRIERNQIEKYGLSMFAPNLHWWEGIDVSARKAAFWVFRGLATATTLVCEDLARIHPVQPVLRAVGPNLVVALLMDDEQEEWRWGSRYATVLSDDPGSSVLTFTSLGMIRRADDTDQAKPEADRKRKARPTRKVALWREAPVMPLEAERAAPLGQEASTWWKLVSQGRPAPLELPVGHHALVLTLGGVRSNTFSLDGRTDPGLTVRLRLKGVESVQLTDTPPGWIGV